MTWVEKPSQATFRADIERVINKCSMENGSDTPDFILAKYLQACLEAFDDAVRARETWHGRNDVQSKICTTCMPTIPRHERGPVCDTAYVNAAGSLCFLCDGTHGHAHKGRQS